MTTQMQQLTELDGKLADRQEKIAKIFEEAKAKDDNGNDVYDLSKVKCLGSDMSPAQIAEKIRELNDECNDLGQQRDTLVEAQKAADGMDRPAGGIKHPNGREPGAGNGDAHKSIGERIARSKRYQEWAKNGAQGSITFREDVLASDLIAKGSVPDTIRSKTLFETTAGWAPESLRIGGFVEAVTRPVQVLDIIPLARTSFEQVVYMEETTRTHAAVETGEGLAYPEAAFALTEQTSSVRKIATSIPVTDEQLEDVAQAEGYLNSRLTFGLRQRLDNQVIQGDGISPNLEGILNVTGIQTQAKGTDPVPDAVFKAMTKVRVTGRAMPTHVLLHPNDWQEIRLLRTSDGVYIWGSPSEAGPERLWGLPVVQADSLTENTGIVGSFSPEWVGLFERRGVDVQVGTVGTQFTEGERTIRADMRAAFVVFRPAAFATVTGI